MQAHVLTFIIPAIALIFSAIFAALWWQNRERLYILAYSYSFGSMAMGVALNIWILGGYGPVGLVAYHVLSMSGLIALMWGTSHRVRQRIPILAYSVTVAIACVICWYALEQGETLAGKLAQNTNAALLFALGAQNLYHAPSRNTGDRALVWVLAIFAAFGFIRPLLSYLAAALFGPGPEGVALLSSLHAVLLALLLTLMAMCLVSSIIADNLRRQTEESTYDPLSGLRMRGAFESAVAELQSKAEKQGIPMSLIVADLDHFKQVNDTLGHSTGDQLIKTFGEMLAAKIRPSDVAGRIGGEEFGVLAWNCDTGQAAALAERMREATERLQTREGEDNISVSASFGVATFDRDDSYVDVFNRADAALYKAKRAGRNCVFGDRDDASKDLTAAPIAENSGPENGAPNHRTGAEVVPLTRRQTG
ncbi:diguanylate cyclase [uncultured Erythrobacter sp.]|uniref:GGDEF domain-containing protein n=1 Tax=uncultured Erythrobacter sp. TaxID=263913 RepID=UPI002628E689|nr:diguanylate cyclase [uncultured Erythrobacter sp.]